MTESILMVVYSSVNVPGTEFIALNGSLPTCLNGSEPHVVGSNNSVLTMRPTVIQKEGSVICSSFHRNLIYKKKSSL